MFADHYACLIVGQWPAIDADTAFDRHALACVLSIARDEDLSGRSTIAEATGLGPKELMRLVARNFPAVPFDNFGIDLDEAEPERDEEEEILFELLLQHRNPEIAASLHFARIVARRAMRDDHLWQDLGLFERAELTRLLNRHFPMLAAGNTRNMKWKKYFYRRLCEAEGLSLCTAPSCRECDDFDACFGEETGESRLARLKNGLVQWA
ncbi:MAG TPA: nitrogen fixation protein NifQ [Rhizobium sp.]|nr:nitrogen fixation protein NifQ [Rhizobium sp.]